ncbi:MAG: DUF3103 family protein [Acidobacteria bacterium]|nr:DUF3103 family protein [Acidobacteriota bacterium]
MKWKTITITLAFTFSFFAFAQSNKQEQMQADKHASENANRLRQARMKHASIHREVNTDLEMLAKGMAESLSDPHLRNFLRKEIRESNKREKILRMDSFADKATKAKDMPANAKAPMRLKEVKATKQKLGNRRYLELFGTNDVDIYFPVPEHRDLWKGNDNLLVAFSPSQDESEVTQIVAYSAKNGRRVLLDSKQIPAIPVLVVTVSEHDNLDPLPEIASRSIAPDLPPDTPQQEDPNLVPGSEGPHKGGNSYIDLHNLKIFNDHEPWYKGDPEIYAVCLQWNGSNPAGNNKRDLARVNDENKWYYVGDIASWQFNSAYADGTLIAIWERDGTAWYHDLFVNVATSVIDYFAPGVGTALSYAYQIYTVAEGDDFVCKREFSKSWIPWDGTLYRYLYSDGYMYAKKRH